MGDVLCRNANACHSPRAAGDLQSLWLDKESRQQRSTLQNACKGLPSDPWQQSFQGTCARIRIRRIASSAYCLRRGELESLYEGKESKWFLGGRGDCMLSARLKAWSAQLCRDLQCLGDLQKTIGIEQKEGEVLCLGSSDRSTFKVGR